VEQILIFQKTAIVLAIVLSTANLSAQNDTPQVFLNHISVVLDSDTYRHIFDSSGLQIFGDTAERKTITVKETWSGKYFRGSDSYFELFPPGGVSGGEIGTVGLGFMTFKHGDIQKILSAWQSSDEDSVKKDTVTYVSNGEKHQWFYSLSINSLDSLLRVAAWVMENTPSELKEVGFTNEEIERPISWKQYVEKMKKKQFTKAFNRIISITLSVSKRDYEYLKKSLIGFGLKESKNHFYNDFTSVNYLINEQNLTMLESVEIELSKSFEENKVVLSNHVKLQIKGNKALFIFN
jgi:hypothetical protein